MNQPTPTKRARYITSSGREADPSDEYAFCESATATSFTPWHIRKLDGAGLKLTGGITTQSLCERVQPFKMKTRGFGGWDLNVKFHEGHFKHICPACLEAYRKQTGA